MTAPSTTPPLEEREAVARTEEAPAMVRVLQMIDALPAAFLPSDDKPLRDAMPGCWPTIGDLRSFLAERDAAIARAEEARAAVAWTNEVTPEINDWGQATVCLAPEEFERMRALTTPEHPHGD